MKVRCRNTGNIYEIKEETLHPLTINSSLVSAQNRKRLYWTNIGAEQDGLFGDLKCMIPQPKDKGILLKDILEPEVDKKYYLSDIAIEGILKHKAEQKEKGFGFGAVIKKDDEKMNALKVGGKEVDDLVETIVHNTMPRSSKTGKGGTGPLSRNDGKTYCLDTKQTNAIQIVAMRGRNPDNNSRVTKGCPTKQMLEAREDGKTNCITTVQKDNLVYTANNLQYGDGYALDNRAYYEDGKQGTLDTKPNRAKTLLNTSRIRRLTPLECERLQTMKDNYTAHVSDSQRYKMIGNGWTTEVIAHIFSYLN